MNLKEYVHTFIDSNFNTNESLPFPVSDKIYPRGTIITQIGDIEKYAYFINFGIAEMSINKDDNDWIIDFYFENDFFSSYESLLLNSPSITQIIALTELSVERVLKTELQNAYAESCLANKIGRYATERLYLKKVKRERNLLLMTAEQNYIQLLHNSNQMINHIPVYKIAKYLGIKAESLSRIRKKSIS